MKLLNLLALFLVTLSTALSAPAVPAGPKADEFKLSDEEIKMMGLNDTEAQELKKFFEALNTLSPAQRKELEDLGKATEEKMRTKNLDPNNFDDLMKFMENEQQNLAPKPKAAPTAVELPKIEKPIITPVTSPANAKALVNDILSELGTFTARSQTRESLEKKLLNLRNDLVTFTYFLNILKAPDLLALLGSKEFVRLYNHLENIHTALFSYTPSIIPKKKIIIDEDDPYEVLDISYDATDEEIKNHFEDLKKRNDPALLKKELTAQKIDPQLIKKRVKESKRSFGVLKDAYAQLKNPQQRAATGKKLQQKIATERQNESVSNRAFDHVYNALQAAFSLDGVNRKMQELLEKYKPQELATAKVQLELEKKAIERSKIPGRIPQPPFRFVPPVGKYDEFYNSFGRDFTGFGRGKRFESESQFGAPAKKEGKPEGMGGKEGGAGGGKKEGGKEADKGGGDKGGGDKGGSGKGGKEAGGGKKEGSKPEKPEESKEQTPEAKQLSLRDIEDVGSILAASKQMAEAIPEDGHKQFDQLVKNLKGELGYGGSGTDAAQQLLSYLDQRKVGALEERLRDIATTFKKKSPDPKIKAAWSEKVKPFIDEAKEWNDKLYTLLAARRNLNTGKWNQYKLNRAEGDVWKAPKKDKGDKGINLGSVRQSIKSINTYIDSINKSFKK